MILVALTKQKTILGNCRDYKSRFCEPSPLLLPGISIGNPQLVVKTGSVNGLKIG
jgi:hypothetical protein